MKPEDAEDYTQALGQVVAGGWRQIALGLRLGVPKALNLSVDEWVKQRLGGYVKYSIAERQEAVKALAGRRPRRTHDQENARRLARTRCGKTLAVVGTKQTTKKQSSQKQAPAGGY